MDLHGTSLLFLILTAGQQHVRGTSLFVNDSGTSVILAVSSLRAFVS